MENQYQGGITSVSYTHLDVYKRQSLGHIPSYAYENFCEMYEAYHRLGGNGMITHMYEEVKELEIRKEK